MKIDRLIGIITLLLQTERMTAPELAKRFEVSRRTINRDVEDICKSGIPVTTVQGVNGGISIMDSYKIDKTLFTGADLRAIIAGLSSLDSIARDRKYQNIIDKFSANKDSVFSKNHIVIDLSSHYRDTLAPKIELLEASIDSCTAVSFVYHNQNGEHPAVVDPYLVVFRWLSWYLFGFERSTGQFKLYKLNRICHMEQTDQTFELREIPEEKLNFGSYFTDDIQAVVLFDKSEKYRLIEGYGSDSFTEAEDGRLLFSFPFTNRDYLLNWVLSFGEKAELIEPKEFRGLIQTRLADALEKYR